MSSKASRWISGAIDGGLGKSLQGNFSPDRNRVQLLAGPDGRIFVIPFWIVPAASGSLAALPWFRWSKRFSLRTLLIATTLIAALLGVVAWLR